MAPLCCLLCCLGVVGPAVLSDDAAVNIGVSSELIMEAIEASPQPSTGQVVVVYFSPRDREPAKGYIQRMERILQETASFYEKELTRHGYVDRHMNVLRGPDNRLEIIEVVGKDTANDYDNPDGARIRAEVVPVLRARGIDPEQSVILLFCNLMDYDPVASRISHHSPYYGGGSHLAGTAWQCDSEILDPQRLTDPTPILDGEYGRITIGRHNSIFIGGVVHELGHALSLPHCRERSDESILGTALMGSGNRTFRQELRQEGKGTFLTLASAMRLAAHPVFLQRVSTRVAEVPKTDWKQTRASVISNRSIQIETVVQSSVPVHGVIAYFDPEGGSDYDATTATAIPNEQGKVLLMSDRLPPNRAGELRLVACHVNGATSTSLFDYRVDAEGRPNVDSIRRTTELQPMIDAIRSGDLTVAAQKLNDLRERDESLHRIGKEILDRFVMYSKLAVESIADVSPLTKELFLSRCRPMEEKVGWMRPTYDAVPDENRLLSLDGDWYASGIYAHAPARHVYEIDRAWKRLTGRCGLQSQHPGSVDFQIFGDDRLLWRSDSTRLGQSASFDIDVSNMNRLTLVVGNAGDGNGGDWGVWIEPRLTR